MISASESEFVPFALDFDLETVLGFEGGPVLKADGIPLVRPRLPGGAGCARINSSSDSRTSLIFDLADETEDLEREPDGFEETFDESESVFRVIFDLVRVGAALAGSGGTSESSSLRTIRFPFPEDAAGVFFDPGGLPFLGFAIGLGSSSTTGAPSIPSSSSSSSITSM